MNNRVSEFTASGQFVEAFGWDVAPEGAPGDTPEDQLEVCTDVCQSGTAGAGAGQLNSPVGLAVGASGAIYLAETENLRVQKFSASGEFLLMFGAEVNKTNGGDLCTRADLEGGDVCGAGVEGTGPGEFSGWAGGDFIDAAADGTVLVGDQSRVQSFDENGVYVGEIPLPEERSVRALAFDPGSDDLYVAVNQAFALEFPEVPVFYRLDAGSGALIDEIEVGNPDGTADNQFPLYGFTLGLATDSAGNVYAVVQQNQTLKQIWLEVAGFDPSGACLPGLCPGDEFAKGENGTGIGGIEASDACGVPSDDLFISYSGAGKGYVRSYGPAPQCDVNQSPPQIEEQYAIAVRTDKATVQASINPRLQPDTTYYVEYGTGPCSAGGCQAQPAPPGALLTADTVGLPVTTADIVLANLSPGATYHYRFVAQSGGGGPVKGAGGKVGDDGSEGTFTTFPLAHAPRVSCPNQAFRSGQAAFLPDCRAYEMVSPVDKENDDIVPLKTNVSGPAALAQAASGGGKLSYSAFRAFANPESAPWTSQYLAERGSAGWLSRSISPPREGRSLAVQLRGLDVQYNVFSADLCSGWLMQDSEPRLDAAAPPGFPGLYRREDCGQPSFSSLVRTEPQLIPPEQFWPELEGVSADGSCAVFRANGKLTAEASDVTEEGLGIYQVYETCGAETRLVSVLPDGTASDLHSSAGTASGARLVHRDHSVLHALSADGTRVYWTAADGVGKAPGTIYVRDNAKQDQSALVGSTCTEAEKACTFPVSETVSTANGVFRTANPDGSVALFTIGEDLYRFDFAGSGSTSSLIAGGVKGLLGTSEDLSRIYLVSDEDRAPGATAGERNLYLYESGNFTFIASLSAVDVRQGNDVRSPANVEPSKHTARVTPDGGSVAFMSTAPLTGFDNVVASTGVRAAEVYVFEVEANGGAGALSCVSCTSTGAKPAARAMEKYSNGAETLWVAAQLPTWETQLYARRALSDDGSYLFFESFDPLVQRDTNGRQDVYEWQPGSSEGDCEAVGAELFVESAHGCISLISAGDSGEDSAFLDASSSGADVFFATTSSLLPQDPDLVDIYDARVGGGFPTPPQPAPPCEGEACRNPSPPPPSDPVPASSTSASPGKKRQACPKSKRRVVRHRKARCVKHHKSRRNHKAQRTHQQRGGVK